VKKKKGGFAKPKISRRNKKKMGAWQLNNIFHLINIAHVIIII
jgi:hypothetical protein